MTRNTVVRRPRAGRRPPVSFVFTAEIPEVPDGRGPSMAMVMPTLAGAAIVALVLSPVFALLAAVSAMAVLGRSAGTGWARYRAGRRRAKALAAAGGDLGDCRAAWAADETRRRRAASTLESEPWQERFEPDEGLSVELGTGPVTVVHDRPDDLPDELADMVAAPIELRGVPLTAPIDRGLAVTGDREPALAFARWAVASIGWRIGPADLAVSLLTTVDRKPDWAWLQAMPLVSPVEGVEQRSRATLVVVDGCAPDAPGMLSRLVSGRLPNSLLLWVGEADEVPAGCERRVHVTADGRFVEHEFASGSEQRGTVHWLSDAAACRLAERLSGYDDPELDEVDLPDRVSLADLVVDGPASVIGWCAAGPFSVDLVRDGPHVLVAGTTGSGKSELLRTLVVSMAASHDPGDVAFVLFDFKGGGAFDAVAELPHVAAVVTDLDPTEAGRALRGLRAEVRDREVRLRDVAETDVTAIDLPRLVIVIDEFATLAEELPEFLAGLVDVARRGRSLGIHLVLATQRPAGVVTADIRANTNLRVCLRVQSPADSMDVIETDLAAGLPPIAGRCLVRRGSLEPELVQVAGVGRIDAVEVRPGARPAQPWLPALEPIEDLPVAVDGTVLMGLLDDPDQRLRRPLSWHPDDGLLLVGADARTLDRALTTAIAGLVTTRPDRPVYVLAGAAAEAMVAALPMVVDVIEPGDRERVRRLLDRLDQAPATLVIHRWSLVADAAGHRVDEQLAQHVRRPGPGTIVTAATDREVPSRVASHLAERVVFELTDPHGYLGFGLRPTEVPRLGGMAAVHPRSRLAGQVAPWSHQRLAALAADRCSKRQPPPIEVLGDRVVRADLPGPRRSRRGVRVAIGRDIELAVHDIEIDDHLPVVVLGRPGSGRTTALETIRSQLSGAEVVDDAERLTAEMGQELVTAARDRKQPLLVAATPAAARSFGSWLGPLLGQATVILLNPSRADAELCRVVAPDLATAPVGRAVVVEHGRVSVVQLAA